MAKKPVVLTGPVWTHGVLSMRKGFCLYDCISFFSKACKFLPFPPQKRWNYNFHCESVLLL
ncbi:hypothetical protein OIU77_011797 [Salix suchowensis]|uniref:Uncharacterized protein n=1 Tax=Salix suchowensis TaxID=1278906 RepID=A0ABQ9A2H9_9ROSI|nr:hypothetical protein OIU77_011797 [Salix suchowensis]